MAAFANRTNLSETTFLCGQRIHLQMHPHIHASQRTPLCGSSYTRQLPRLAHNRRDAKRRRGRTGMRNWARPRPPRPWPPIVSAPKKRRTGPLEPDILAQAVKGLRLAPDAIIASSLGGQWSRLAGAVGTLQR
jgi:hypothetical protein